MTIAYLYLEILNDIAAFGIGKYLKQWMRNQFKGTESLDKKYNVFMREKTLLK